MIVKEEMIKAFKKVMADKGCDVGFAFDEGKTAILLCKEIEGISKIVFEYEDGKKNIMDVKEALKGCAD